MITNQKCTQGAQKPPPRPPTHAPVMKISNWNNHTSEYICRSIRCISNLFHDGGWNVSGEVNQQQDKRLTDGWMIWTIIWTINATIEPATTSKLLLFTAWIQIVKPWPHRTRHRHTTVMITAIYCTCHIIIQRGSQRHYIFLKRRSVKPVGCCAGWMFCSASLSRVDTGEASLSRGRRVATGGRLLLESSVKNSLVVFLLSCWKTKAIKNRKNSKLLLQLNNIFVYHTLTHR